MKGGVAKTTLAINLADSLVRRSGKSVLLIDVDPQFNATQCLISPENYITHLEANGDTVLTLFDRAARSAVSSVSGSSVLKSKTLESITPITVKEGFDLLPGNLELYRLEMAPGGGRENRLKKYLEYIQTTKKYDIILIDTPPTPSIWMTSALIASDYYLIPVKGDPLSLTGIDLLQSVIEDKKDNFSLTIKCAGVVLTITEDNTIVFANAVKQLKSHRTWKNFLYKHNIPKRVDVARIQSDQKMILDCNNPEIKQALAGVTAELLERIGC